MENFASLAVSSNGDFFTFYFPSLVVVWDGKSFLPVRARESHAGMRPHLTSYGDQFDKLLLTGIVSPEPIEFRTTDLQLEDQIPH